MKLSQRKGSVPVVTVYSCHNLKLNMKLDFVYMFSTVDIRTYYAKLLE